MNKYEIMLIMDPNSTMDVVNSLIKEVFKDTKASIEELKNIELAYPINKSKTGKYILITLNAEGEEIIEFNRKVNIQKTLWRMLAINLDSEKGLNRKANPKRIRKSLIKRYEKFNSQNGPREPREPREHNSRYKSNEANEKTSKPEIVEAK